MTERLRREEGIEGALDHLRRHAGASVADADCKILTGRELAFARRPLVEPFVRRFDRDASAVRHRVARIDAEIQDRVLKLIGIDERRPQTRGADNFDLDARADGAADQFFEIGYESIDVGRFRIERLAAREGQ